MYVCMHVCIYVGMGMCVLWTGENVRVPACVGWIPENLHEMYKQHIQKHADLPNS